MAPKDPLGNARDTEVDIYGSQFVSGTVKWTPQMDIPGIGTGAAYASGDAFGTSGTITVDVPRVRIVMLKFWDFDDEGLAKQLALFRASFTATADNSAFAPSDSDLINCEGYISLAASDFANWNSNQMGVAYIPDFRCKAPELKLYFQWITLGADNIAAGSIPKFSLGYLPEGI